MVFNSTYTILEYDIILLNMKYPIKYTIPFRPVYELFAILLSKLYFL